jgi:hypothetical protein
MATSTGEKNAWRKRLPFMIVAIAVIALVAPAVAYGGFMVNVATVTFSETTGSLTATSPQSSVASVTVYNYVAMKAGGTFHTSDQSISNTEVAKITISLVLTTPSGTNVTVTNTNIQGGIGTRSHTVALGPGEGVTQSGMFLLTINISVDITTPAGVQVSSLSLTMTKSFTVS